MTIRNSRDQTPSKGRARSGRLRDGRTAGAGGPARARVHAARRHQRDPARHRGPRAGPAVNADMTAAEGERELLRRTVEDILAGHCTPARVAAAAAGSGWDESLWQALEETGLTLAGSPEEAGGSGGDLLAAADIVAAAGAAAAPVPLAETLAAGMLLAPAGRGRHGRNLAGEPRDDVDPGADAEVHDVPAGTADYARRLLRLFRSLLIAGAAQRALDLTVTYVKEREQFGRPLAKFPTVQQELARMAGEVALIGAATQAAVAAEYPAAEYPAAGDAPVAGGEVMSAVLAAKA